MDKEDVLRERINSGAGSASALYPLVEAQA